MELEPQQKEVFYQLLVSYADVIAESPTDLGQTDCLQHSIDTGDTPPIRQPVRRLPPQRRSEVQQLLQGMLQSGVIEPSRSPWASPIVLVKKKDGSTRFCVDYRKVNGVTRRDAYPLPRIDATLDTLSGSEWFSTLDLISGYWQVQIEESDRQKNAFCTTEGLFQFRVMPFGLCNAPATFQRLMDLVLSGLQWAQCLVYLDDIIILGRTFEEHIQNIRLVLQRLREAGLKIKPSKCTFFQQKVCYLGHVISREGIAPDSSKTDKVASWPTPLSTKEVQQFLGFSSYYRRFVQNYATIAKPLHRLTERPNKFVWTTECQTAFDELRSRLVSPPILAHPDFSRPFILDTDASDIGIGSVLSQLGEDGQEKVVAYGSRLLTKAERQYCTTRKELLAVVTFTKQYRPYLIGQQFTLRTDHNSLSWLQTFREPQGQLARWLEQLQEFNFTIVHRRGRKHNNADALSRLPCRQCGRNSHLGQEELVINTTAIQSPLVPAELLRNAQLEDPSLGPLLRGKQHGCKPCIEDLGPTSRETRRLLQIWDQLQVNDGVLCRLYLPVHTEGPRAQQLVPKALQNEVLCQLHEGIGGGHLGIDKTLSRLKERFYWPGHHMDVTNWCRSCKTCASRKDPPRRPRAPLKNMKAGYPLQIIATDIIGPFPTSAEGNKYILVASDYFTRWVEAYAIPNLEATTVAQKLTKEFFLRFGPPEQLHADQGRNFESSVIAEICNTLGIVKTRTTPYHPQSDGLVERLNRTIINMLALATEDQPYTWESKLPSLCMAYNCSVQSTTGYTPFYLMFGRQARLPIDIMYGTPGPEPAPTTDYAKCLKQSLEKSYQLARERMGLNLQRQKDLYDTRIHGHPFVKGDLVWLHTPAVPKGHSKKLHRPWKGPYRILKCLSNITYRIQDIRFPKRKSCVHFNRLKPYFTPESQSAQFHHPPVRSPPPVQCPPNRQHPQDLGSQLILVDGDESDNIQASTQNPIHDEPSTPNQPRYPQRQRRPPDYYHNEI